MMKVDRKRFLAYGMAVALAGTAAALCAKNGVAPRALDAKTLVDTLKSQGVFLG